MDYNKRLKDRDTVVDIGNSESEFEEDRKNESVTGNKRAKTLLWSPGGNLNFEGSEGECSSNSYRSSVKSSDEEYEDIESLTYSKRNGEYIPPVDKPRLKEKHKSSNSKKAPKPPRPRKGPSLDTADLQLVKEIAEHTMKRRARVERLKALKKRKAAKSSSPPPSSNSSLFAMAITVIFFLVIILQAFGSGQSSTLSFNDSPKQSGSPSSGLISIQLGNNILESDGAQQIAKPTKKFALRKIFQSDSSFV